MHKTSQLATPEKEIMTKHIGCFNPSDCPNYPSIQNVLGHAALQLTTNETHMLLLGRLLSEKVRKKKNIGSLCDLEFKVFSQWGDDGIIQWLIHNLELPNKTFIEFGVEDYRESNTRFLMMNDNWSGLVIDGSEQNVANITNSEYYWKYELLTKSAFIDVDNINSLISESGFDSEVGLLHIDIDGVDYWVWKAIDVISPAILILEYNSVFGVDRSITVPYDRYFNRTEKHYSNLYFGASLRALHHLSTQKGYTFIGCNGAGNNAYFVRSDKLNEVVRECSLSQGYVISRFRESRNFEGELSFATGDKRIELIRGLPVYNIDSAQVEPL